MTDRDAAEDPPAAGPVPASAPVNGAAVSSVRESAAGGFERLFRAQFATMFRLAHLLGADDPEDVAQEAFARLHPRWSTLRDPSTAGGYLRTTVVNLVRSRREHLAMAARRLPPVPPGIAPSAESDAVLRADNAALIGALRAIAPRHREIGRASCRERV